MFLPDIIIKQIIGYFINYKYFSFKYKLSLGTINRSIFQFISKHVKALNIAGSLKEKEFKSLVTHINSPYCIIKSWDSLLYNFKSHTDVGSVDCINQLKWLCKSVTTVNLNVTPLLFAVSFNQSIFPNLKDLTINITCQLTIQPNLFPRLSRLSISLESYKMLSDFISILHCIRDTLEHLHITLYSTNSVIQYSSYLELVEELSKLNRNQLKHFTLNTTVAEICQFIRSFPMEILNNQIESLTELNITNPNNQYQFIFNEETYKFFEYNTKLVSTSLNFDSPVLLIKFLKLINNKPHLLSLNIDLTVGILPGTETSKQIWPELIYVRSLTYKSNSASEIDKFYAKKQNSLRSLDIQHPTICRGPHKIVNFNSFISSNTSIETFKLQIIDWQDSHNILSIFSKNNTITELNITINITISLKIKLDSISVQFLSITRYKSSHAMEILNPFTYNYTSGLTDYYYRPPIEKKNASLLNKLFKRH
ncbi:putative protein serine/threonine kinase [Tieghemostelium lacteum]|uniref:F-box domain-containing protein n=1 Tax=Tieghemostelium lacteum TaxID=361077 RepID=A0A151ZA84_TIELA|nr:putative protein serine/threonine kinase [Tieghemostelium lacteum]|eukprot:KYQ90857.1 putative protein serine/threonine kinase [Tieghemostelium lacteum]